MQAGPETLFLIVVPLFIGFAVIIRLIAGQMNHGRIDAYINGIGGRVEEITWEPLGPGWFGEKDSAIYRVRYRDQNGNLHVAYCKTSMLSGVYLTQDNIISQNNRSKNSDEPGYYNDEPDNPRSLEEENRILKEEIRRLKSRNDN